MLATLVHTVILSWTFTEIQKAGDIYSLRHFMHTNSSMVLQKLNIKPWKAFEVIVLIVGPCTSHSMLQTTQARPSANQRTTRPPLATPNSAAERADQEVFSSRGHNYRTGGAYLHGLVQHRYGFCVPSPSLLLRAELDHRLCVRLPVPPSMQPVQLQF